MVGGLGEVTTTRRRLSGYRQALKDWKRPFDSALVVKGDFRVGSGIEAETVYCQALHRSTSGAWLLSTPFAMTIKDL